jgi:membrane protease YdiL (CAAX protease family)
MAALKLNGRNLSELGWKWPASNFALASWLIPLCYATVTYVIVWSLGFGGFPNHDFMTQLVRRMGLPVSPLAATILYVVLGGSFGLTRGLASALGEEIGWRGFLVPELSKNVGFTATALLSGVVWSCWHYPLLIWGGLQQRNASSFWSQLFHRPRLVHLVSVRLDAAEKRKPVDRRSAASQPQPLYTGRLHPLDPRHSTNLAPFCRW